MPAALRFTHRQLALFLALVEHRHHHCRRAGMPRDSATVSVQLKDLADAVGLPLYEQLGGSLVLTEAGEALARTARLIDDARLALEQRVAALKGLTQGRLRIAVVSTAQYFVPRLLGSFCSRHPHIDIALQVLNRDGVVARLRDNRDDLYVMSMPPATSAPSGACCCRTRWSCSGRPEHTARGQALAAAAAGGAARRALHPARARLGHAPGVRRPLRRARLSAPTCASSSAATRRSRKRSPRARPGRAVTPCARRSAQRRPAASSSSRFRASRFSRIWFVLHPEGKALSPIAAEFVAHAAASVSPASPRARGRGPAAPASRRS